MTLPNEVEAFAFHGRGIGVCVFDGGVDDGFVNLLGVFHEQGVNFATTDDHQLLIFTQGDD